MSETPKGPRVLKYRGNHTAPYDAESGTGLLGKVIGPDLNGRYFAVDHVEYDADIDRTRAYLIQLIPPQQAFDRAVDR